MLISVQDRILFHEWSKELKYLFILTTSEIKFDLPPKSTKFFIFYVFKNKELKIK